MMMESMCACHTHKIKHTDSCTFSIQNSTHIETKTLTQLLHTNTFKHRESLLHFQMRKIWYDNPVRIIYTKNETYTSQKPGWW